MTDWKRRAIWLTVAWFAFMGICASGVLIFSVPTSAASFWAFVAACGTFGPIMAIGIAKGSE